MRKLLSILICAVMIVSLFSVNISAADATPINNAADFAAMSPDGNYYLTADITIETTYEQPFVGMFNGNGKTITVKAPLFAQFDGTVKNLTLEGSLTGATNLAAFALYTEDGMTAYNVVNKANITVTGLNDTFDDGICAGGILADSGSNNESFFTLCSNYGTITNSAKVVKTASSGGEYATWVGGFIGRCDAVTMKFCNNYGDVTGESRDATVGGFVGRSIYVSEAPITSTNFYDCTNSGKITSGYDVGGFVGNLGISGNNAVHEFVYCVNDGEIYGGGRVGSFIGYCYAGGSTYAKIISCLSLANVYVGRAATNLAGTAQNSFGSLFIGYTNSVNTEIRGSLAFAELLPIGENDNTRYLCILGCSSFVPTGNENNYLFDNETTIWYTYSTGTAANQIAISEVIGVRFIRGAAAELSDGTILAKLNAAADTAVFSQGTTNPVIDATLRAARAALEEEPGGTTNPGNDTTGSDTTGSSDTTAPNTDTASTDDGTTAAPGDGTTAAPGDGTTAGSGDSETTNGGETGGCSGCGSVVVSGVAIVSVLGMAIVIAKKKRD